jgi:membrane protease YdiL (CAAX protease family)
MPPMRALKPWQAWVAFVVGGGVAQAAQVVVVVVALMAMAADRGSLETDALQDLTRSFPVMAGAALSVGLTLLATSFLAPLLAKVPIREALGLSRPPALAVVAVCFGVVALGPTSEILVALMQRVAPRLTFGTLDAIDDIVARHPLWMLWPVLALSPGVCEEMFFRGAFQRAFGRGALAIGLSAVTFACFHLDPHHVVGVLPVGAYLAWTAARTSSTWVPIAGHVANNSASIVVAKLSAGEPKPIPGQIDTPWWVTLTGLAIAAVMAAVIVRSTRPVEPRAG